MKTGGRQSAGVRPSAGAVLEIARATKGFMPDQEGLALSRLSRLVHQAPTRPRPRSIVEIGAYCGRSTLYLVAGLLDDVSLAGAPAGAPAKTAEQTVVFSVDHHHGSEENQAGWEHHDPSLVDPRSGRLDTLPRWRAAIEDAGVEDLAVAVVGDSAAVAAHWSGPAELVFIDGGHGEDVAWADYRSWAPRVADGGHLAIHDVFPDPADGGRPPYELYRRAISSGAFAEEATLGCGSLRVLKRIRPGW